MVRHAVVGMSGGVDSSVAAYLVREAGYDVTGATMRLFDNGDISIGEDKTCGSFSSIEDARSVADRLGISFVVYDLREEFLRDVIGSFIADYENGRTPNPCVVCNSKLKFTAMYDLAYHDLIICGGEGSADAFSCSGIGEEADSAGAASVGGRPATEPRSESVSLAGNGNSQEQPLMVATGHYAVIERGASGRFMLRKAADPAKDQSYFLAVLTQEQLARTLFPLGGLTKPEVREIAESLGLVTAGKRESQDICFVPGGDYASFITGYTGREYPPGDFTDLDGNVMGRHKGIIRYTIGQRKGLGLALKRPAYVCDIDAVSNRVILGDNSDLFTRELVSNDFNWVSMGAPRGDIRASARIRYRHREAAATVIPLAENSVRIVFDEPQRAITRGQSVVVYDGDYVLGGGTID